MHVDINDVLILGATRYTNTTAMWSPFRAIVGCNGTTCKLASFYFSSFIIQLIIKNAIRKLYCSCGFMFMKSCIQMIYQNIYSGFYAAEFCYHRFWYRIELKHPPWLGAKKIFAKSKYLKQLFRWGFFLLNANSPVLFI